MTDAHEVFRLLDIRLQMEGLLCRREGMVAENLQRVHRRESLAWAESDFENLADEFESLRLKLRE